MSKLFLVPTPIGNLEDITLRALRILKEVDLVAAEDTRKTSILLKHYNISKPVVAFHQHNEHRMVEQLIGRIQSGATIALVTDAGTPAISDPGFLLVRAAIAASVEVECLPGFAWPLCQPWLTRDCPPKGLFSKAFCHTKKAASNASQQLPTIHTLQSCTSRHTA